MIAPSAKLISSRRIATALLLLALALCNVIGAGFSSGPETLSELQAAIETVLKETKTPGAAIAIVSRDKVEWVAGVGKADATANKPVTAETLFRIGSVTKSFAALAALKLQEEGKLKLTDTVKQWVPDVAFSNRWEATDPVRLVHLMEHTAGFDEIALREYAHNDPTPVSLRDALEFGASSRVSRWRPGSRMAYCNSGSAILAAVIEKVSGKGFEDYVQENFFNPLQMDTASYFLTPEVERSLTKLYEADGITPYPYWHFLFRPAGSINASAKDMANFVRFFLQRGNFDDTQILQPSSVERMEAPESLPSAKLGMVAGYGLFNTAFIEGPFVFRGHGGAVTGGLAEMAYLPDNGRGYVAMINSGNGHAIFRIAKLIRHYVTRDLAPPTLPPAAKVPAELQQRYSGYYQTISPRCEWLHGFERLLKMQKLKFTTDGLSTTIHGLHQERWIAVSDRLFRKENEFAATLALLPDDEGKILIERAGWETFEKISALEYWAQAGGMVLVSALVLSSILFAPIWELRKFFGKLQNAGPMSVRILPFTSAALLIAFDALIACALWGLITANYSDDLLTLGVPSLLTVSILVMGIAFPLSSITSLYVIYRERNAVINRAIYWHSALVSLAIIAVAIYYGYWGLIGLRLWA